MPPRSSLRIWALVMTLAGATSVAAQDPQSPAPAGFGVGASVTYQSLGNEDFEGIDNGFGLETTARYTTDGGFQLLGGIRYNIHDIARAPGNVHFFEFFVDPRYVIELLDAERIVLLVAGRVAYVHLAVSGGADASANGFMAGGSVGAIYALTSRLGLEATASFGGFWSDAFEFEGLPASGTANGSVASLQLGLVWSFPR